MKAIQTKYLPPTNTKGSRIKAMIEGNSISLDWINNLEPEENHIYAAKELIKKLNWKNSYVTGALPDGSYVHVPVIMPWGAK